MKTVPPLLSKQSIVYYPVATITGRVAKNLAQPELSTTPIRNILEYVYVWITH